MLLRCNGAILRRDAREGIAGRTGKPYRIPYVTVLVESSGVAEVNVPEVLDVRLSPGDIVDWLVEVTAFGNNPQARYVSDIAPLALSVPDARPASASK